MANDNRIDAQGQDVVRRTVAAWTLNLIFPMTSLTTCDARPRQPACRNMTTRSRRSVSICDSSPKRRPRSVMSEPSPPVVTLTFLRSGRSVFTTQTAPDEAPKVSTI